MKKTALVILLSLFLLALVLFFLPIQAPFLSKIIEFKINEKLHGNVSIKSSSITALRRIHVKGLKFTPIKRGVSFSCDEIIINYNIPGSLFDLPGKRSFIIVKNMYLENGNSMLSNFSGLLFSKDNPVRPLFEEISLQSFKADKDIFKNMILAKGNQLKLEGTGSETKNGNVIDYNLKIMLSGEMADKFRQAFAMPQPKDQGSRDMNILLTIQGQPNGPFVTISCDQLKLNFRITNKK